MKLVDLNEIKRLFKETEVEIKTTSQGLIPLPEIERVLDTATEVVPDKVVEALGLKLTSVGHKPTVEKVVESINMDHDVRCWVDVHMAYRLKQNPVLKKQMESMIRKVMNHPGWPGEVIPGQEKQVQ